jgi:uncharacterized protein
VLRRMRPVIEALALLLITFPLAVGFELPTLWFLVPFAWLTLTRRSYAEYGLNLDTPGSVGFHLAVIVAVFVPYALGHYALLRWLSGARLHVQLPPGLAGSAFDQMLIIGLPEEFFFRGYLQTQLDQAWGKPYALLGARCGAGLPAAAALFAVCHVVHGGPARLIVFFPGLLYGWLFARTKTVAVPAAYHAASNLLMRIVQVCVT